MIHDHGITFFKSRVFLQCLVSGNWHNIDNSIFTYVENWLLNQFCCQNNNYYYLWKTTGNQNVSIFHVTKVKLVFYHCVNTIIILMYVVYRFIPNYLQKEVVVLKEIYKDIGFTTSMMTIYIYYRCNVEEWMLLIQLYSYLHIFSKNYGRKGSFAGGQFRGHANFIFECFPSSFVIIVCCVCY